MNKLSLIAFLFLLSIRANADDNQILLQQKAESPYKVGDLICVNDSNGETVCGKIVSAGADVARLEVDKGNESEGIEEVENDGIEVVEEAVEAAPKPKKKSTKHTKKPETPPVPVVKEEKAPEPKVTKQEKTKPVPVPELPGACARTLASIREEEHNSTVFASLPPRDYPFHSISMVSAFNTNFFAMGPAYSLHLDPINSFGINPLFSSLSTPNSSVFSYGGLLRYYRSLNTDKEGFRVSPFLGLISVRSTMNVSRNEYSVSSWITGASVGYFTRLSELFFFNGELGLQHYALLSGDSSKIDLTGVNPIGFISFGILL